MVLQLRHRNLCTHRRSARRFRSPTVLAGRYLDWSKLPNARKGDILNVKYPNGSQILQLVRCLTAPLHFASEHQIDLPCIVEDDHHFGTPIKRNLRKVFRGRVADVPALSSLLMTDAA